MRRHLRERHADDRGLTLIELIVAMGIFTVVLAIFGAGLVTMTTSTVRAQDVTDAGDDLRKAFQRLDKQVRYASSINSAGVGPSGTHYVEFLTTSLRDGQDPLCTQWRYDPGTQKLAYRTWRDVPTGGPSTWIHVADDVRNVMTGADAAPPFEVTFAGGPVLRQQLTVRLDVGRGEGGPGAIVGADVATVFVARNSSGDSPSNADLDGDGQSDSFVCTSHLGRP